MVETYIIRYLLYALHPSLLRFGKRPIEFNRIDAISVHIKDIFENDLKLCLISMNIGFLS